MRASLSCHVGRLATIKLILCATKVALISVMRGLNSGTIGVPGNILMAAGTSATGAAT